MWTPDIRDLEGPRYLAIAGAIAQAIDAGELSPGAQLPPQRDLADHLGVTVGTVTRAYALAREKNLISGEVGRGTFVRAGRSVGQRLEFRPPVPERTVDLSCYRAPSAGLAELVSSALVALSQRVAFLPLQKYPPAAGLPAHRVVASAWIARSGYSPRPEDVLICAGAQQAIQVALATVAGPGDVLLTDALTYPGLKALAGLQGLRLAGVEMDQEGMRPEALRAAVAATGSRAVSLQTTLHNPTIATMSPVRRQAIADLARELNLTIIEDDASSAILVERPPPLASLAAERVIYITGLAKALSPVFRAGFIVCPPALNEAMSNTLHAMTLGCSPFIGEMASALMTSPALDDVMGRMRTEIARRVDFATDILGAERVRTHPASVHLWLTLPPEWRALEFEALARRNGVAVVASDNFATNDTRAPSAVRVSLSPGAGENLLHRGLTTLKSLMLARPMLAATII
ncbi:PLP-dependent aminotransferase family protein [uncultured Enterovirga sp.]|uniref:aminotransferase-like domain-containing protein n=1 Tax=uncultured Enterovirga sp. TaxID=2026352 RepID=UPI0035CCA05B